VARFELAALFAFQEPVTENFTGNLAEVFRSSAPHYPKKFASQGVVMEDLVIEEEGASSALKITLGDFLVFINWMNQTEKSLDRAEALPTLPDLDSGKVKGWVQLVQRLEERFRRSEEKKLALEANVIAQEAQLGQLLSHLHANIASLYDNLGQSQKAEEVRRRAEALHVG
jgi:hypothetical protein